MKEQSLSHTVWDCKNHIVWIPKYRKKSLYKDLRNYVGPLLRELVSQKECKIEEGHLRPDHVHSVPRSGGNNELIAKLYPMHAV